MSLKVSGGLHKLYRKGGRLSLKLGADRYRLGNVISKPKGMHLSTYKRFKTESDANFIAIIKAQDSILDRVFSWFYYA